MSLSVDGFCPACGTQSLVLDAGFLTCAQDACPARGAASSLLHARPDTVDEEWEIYANGEAVASAAGPFSVDMLSEYVETLLREGHAVLYRRLVVRTGWAELTRHYSPTGKVAG